MINSEKNRKLWEYKFDIMNEGETERKKISNVATFNKDLVKPLKMLNDFTKVFALLDDKCYRKAWEEVALCGHETKNRLVSGKISNELFVLDFIRRQKIYMLIIDKYPHKESLCPSYDLFDWLESEVGKLDEE